MCDQLQHASRVRPCPGQSVGGDAAVIRELAQGLFVAIIDVLGHGPEAHELTKVIESYLERYADSDVVRLIKNLHQHLKGTRGAAVGLCAIDSGSGRLEYVGLGNTTLRRFGKTETRMVSQDGVLGQNMRSPVLQDLQLQPEDLLVFYTDGISDRFAASDYPGLSHHAPQEVATNIVQRFGKNHDDAACIAVRYRP